MSIGNKNKSDLNLFCQKSRIAIATYTSSMQDGLFISKVCVNGKEYSSTSGYSTKKEAENDAAGVALIAILQTDFGGKSIEEVLSILEQRHPSKNKKKSKQALSSAPQAEIQVHGDTERSRVHTGTFVTSDQSRGASGTVQQSNVAQMQMPSQHQRPLNVVQNQSQIHSGGPRSVAVRPTQTQSGAMMGQYQAAYSHQQTVVRPGIPGATQHSETIGQAPQQHQATVRPSQTYTGLYSQQTVMPGQVGPTVSGVAGSQGAVMTPKGGGGTREQVQRTPGQPSATSANIHAASYPTGSEGQAPPTQAYAPPTALYHYHQDLVQGYPSPNTAAYEQHYHYGATPPPYMQPSYMHQAPPTSGNQWPYPRPHPPHPRAISSHSAGAYPPPPRPQTVMHTGAQVRIAPPQGIRSMAARFPGAAPSSPQQVHPNLSSPRPPPPPGFSADQSAASLPQTAPNKPLNAIPVTQRTGQGLPCSGSVKQDLESASQTDVSKNLNFGHTKKLEELCKTRNLPAPSYRINQDKGKYFAQVRIGERLFRTQWPCENFEQAKSTAAMEAIANLAMSMSTLSTSDTGNRQQSESSSNSSASALQSQTNPNSQPITTATQPTSQTTKGQSSTAPTLQNQVSKQQQIPSSAQQPITSPSNTTTSNPPPALQPPSFFTNSPGPPTTTATTTAVSASTQIQPKPVKQEIQPPASSKAKAMAVNYKQVLHTHSQRSHSSLVYECTASEDDVGYIATVKVSGKVFTSRVHGTKKAAEIDAAEKAVDALGLLRLQGGGIQQQGKAGYGYGGHTQASSASQPQSVSMVSYKNLLQEHMQKQGLTLPHYETERVDEGFKSTVRVHRHGNESLQFTSSPQPVKKAAEQEAARAACLELKLSH